MEKGIKIIDANNYAVEAAKTYLERHDYEILETSWECKAGTVDIIAIDNDDLVFIEVKARFGVEDGFPHEGITSRKRARYEKIALAFLASNDFNDMPVRFDILSIQGIDDQRAMIRHHVNAFGVD